MNGLDEFEILQNMFSKTGASLANTPVLSAYLLPTATIYPFQVSMEHALKAWGTLIKSDYH